jgi:hypothetical protein
MKRKFIVLSALVAVLTLFLVGCTAPDRAQATLKKSGYTDITIGGHDYFSCSRDDYSSTHFKAKNPVGQSVEGTVCCGLMKSCTVRF